MALVEEKKAGMLIFDKADMSWLNADDSMLLRKDSVDIYLRTYFNYVFSFKGPLYKNIECRLSSILVGGDLYQKVISLVKKCQDFLWGEIGESSMSVEDKITTLSQTWSHLWKELYKRNEQFQKEYPPMIIEGKSIIPDIPPVWYVKKGIDSIVITVLGRLLEKQFGKFEAPPVDMEKLLINTPLSIKLFIAKTLNQTIFLLNNGEFFDDSSILTVYKLMYDKEMSEEFKQDKKKGAQWQEKMRKLFFQNVCLTLFAKYNTIGNVSGEILKKIDITPELTKIDIIHAQKVFLEPIVAESFKIFLKSIESNKEAYVEYVDFTKLDMKLAPWPPCLYESPVKVGEIDLSDIKSDKTSYIEELPLPEFKDLIYFRDVNVEKFKELPSTKIVNDKEKKIIIKDFLNNLFTKDKFFFKELKSRFEIEDKSVFHYGEDITDDKIMFFFKQFQNWLILNDQLTNPEDSYQKKYDAYVNRFIQTLKDEKLEITKGKIVRMLTEIMSLKINRFIETTFGRYDEKLLELNREGASPINKLKNKEELITFIKNGFRMGIMIASEDVVERTYAYLRRDGVSNLALDEMPNDIYISHLLFNLIRFKTYENLINNIYSDVVQITKLSFKKEGEIFGELSDFLSQDDKVKQNLVQIIIDNFAKEGWQNTADNTFNEALYDATIKKEFEKEDKSKDEVKPKVTKSDEFRAEEAARQLLLEEESKSSKAKKKKAKKSRPASAPPLKPKTSSPVQLKERPESVPPPIADKKIVTPTDPYGCDTFTADLKKFCNSSIRKEKKAFERWVNLVKQIDQFKKKDMSVFDKPVFNKNDGYMIMIPFLATFLSEAIGDKYKYAIKGGCLRDIISGSQINDLDISLYDKDQEKEFIALVESAVNEYVTLAKSKTDTIKKLEITTVGKVTKLQVEIKPEKVLDVEISIPSDFSSGTAGTDDLRIYDLDINQIVLDVSSKLRSQGYFRLSLSSEQQIYLGVRLNNVVQHIIDNKAIILKPPNIIFPTTTGGDMTVQFNEIQKLVQRQKKHDYTLDFPKEIKDKYGQKLVELMIGSIYKMAYGASKNPKLTELQEKYKDEISFSKIIDLIRDRDEKIKKQGKAGYFKASEPLEEAGSKPPKKQGKKKKKGGTRKKQIKKHKQTKSK